MAIVRPEATAGAPRRGSTVKEDFVASRGMAASAARGRKFDATVAA
jgi:hypothetical protein